MLTFEWDETPESLVPIFQCLREFQNIELWKETFLCLFNFEGIKFTSS